MATSSITHNFVFDSEATQRFVDSIDKAEEIASKPLRSFNGRILTDKKDILAFAAKIQKLNGK